MQRMTARNEPNRTAPSRHRTSTPFVLPVGSGVRYGPVALVEKNGPADQPVSTGVSPGRPHSAHDPS